MPDRLIEGFGRFRETEGNYGPDGIMPALADQGQQPEYFVVSCMDSRSSPAMIFNAQPGVIFGHMPMGAIVPPYNEHEPEKDLHAKVKYAISRGISKIIVVGHSQCGAIEAFADKLDDPDISPWIEHAKSAHAFAERKMRLTGTFDRAALLRETERQTVLRSVHNLMKYPVVRNAFKNGSIEIKAWWFDIGSGNLFEYDPSAKEFAPLTHYDLPEADHGHDCALHG